MHIHKITVILLVTVLTTNAKNHCKSVTFEAPRRGHRCITTSQRYIVIHNIPSHICTHNCMQRENCSLANYNHEKRYCQLSSEVCQEIEKNSEFTVTVTIYPCVRWVPEAEVGNSTLVVCHENAKKGRNSYVARIKLQGDILVGRLVESQIGVWKNGVKYETSEDIEVLQVMPKCSATWVPYTPGDPIPHDALVGGYLGDPSSGTPVINGVTRRGDKRCGFYNPATQLGYMVFTKAEAVIEMDILVIKEIWILTQEWEITHYFNWMNLQTKELAFALLPDVFIYIWHKKKTSTILPCNPLFQLTSPVVEEVTEVDNASKEPPILPPPTRWPPFRRRYFQTHFREWKFLYFDSNPIGVCS